MFPFLLPAILGAAGTLGGAAMQSRAANRGANQQNAIIQSELQRRNQLQSLMLPGLLRAFGYASPQRTLGRVSPKFLGQGQY